MKHFSWVSLGIFVLIFFQLIDIQAQKIQKNISIQWLKPITYQTANEGTVSFIVFEGSVDDEAYPVLPRYYDHFPVSADFSDYDVVASNAVYEPLSEQEKSLVPKDFRQNEVAYEVTTVYEKKKPYAAVSFLPIRVNGGRYEKLVSVHLSIEGKGVKKSGKSTRTYADHSVLRSGNWYRVTVAKTGVYKVTYNDLSSLGIPLSNLSSDNISIFGNGGGMLAESNAVQRPDDLLELPIEMHDGGDHSFDAGDYFLFYAEGPHSWEYSYQGFTHNFNLYATTASYFINVDAGIGQKLRVETEDNSAMTPTATVSSYTAYGFYEEDKFNLGEGGRNWFGDKFDVTTTRHYTLSLPSSPVGPMQLKVAGGASSARVSSFQVTVNGQTVGSLSVPVTLTGYLAWLSDFTFTFSAAGGSTDVQLTYNKPISSAVGFLDYLEWQMDCQLRAGSGQTPFCMPSTVGANAVTRYMVGNFSSGMKVWDVTVINQTRNMAGSLSGNTFGFNSPSDTLRHFVAFTDNACYSVTPAGKVANQDLHGTSRVDMVIVAHPDFWSQAERLADFHRSNDGMSVKVVSPQQVYNEFSSGEQDVCAIRDYMKMIYEQTSAAQPQYLLLFGRPSYDYRGIEGDCKIYVPNYQYVSDVNEEHFKANDDFFGLLDFNEGNNGTGKTVDVAVGRFPVSTAAQAKLAVDKTIEYASQVVLGENTPTSNFGDWKNVATFVGDDEEGGEHLETADTAAQIADAVNRNLNIEKIYLDAYQQVTYSSSARYPEVTTDINNRMNKGCLLFTYVGHGGKNGWAHERIIELTDISRWANRYNQPWMLTMTCEFGWCDRSLVSPAEMAFLNSGGGVSAMITTYRVAYTGSNKTYITRWFSNLFCNGINEPLTIGECNRQAKNAGSGNVSGFNMIYVLGDPAMKLAVPRYTVVTDSINGVAVTDFTDTLKALSHVRISGHVEDAEGHLLPDFSGAVYPSVYDKKTVSHTLQNDPHSSYEEFEVQKNILFKGNVTVTDGKFGFSFILPKDINYAYGNGKLSYYASSRTADAAGAYNEVLIGGMSDETITDDNGPEMDLYMNDEQFVNGGTVNSSPTLLVKLKDEYGINTTGNGIGHDLVAMLDDGNQIVLNNYYEAARDSFNCGTVRYPLENLALGTHKMKVRAWDILNNVSERELEFVVVSDEGLVLDHVLNYPNPFTTRTSFYFEHNRPGEVLDVMVTVYTISGKVVRTLESTQCTQGFRSDPIVWDGLDDFGDKIGKGTYLYRLRVRTASGEQTEKIEKIVIL